MFVFFIPKLRLVFTLNNFLNMLDAYSSFLVSKYKDVYYKVLFNVCTFYTKFAPFFTQNNFLNMHDAYNFLFAAPVDINGR